MQNEENVMKKWSMFLAAAACACVLASPLQAAERKKVNISFPTAATTGALYPLGAGIANLSTLTKFLEEGAIDSADLDKRVERYHQGFF